MSTLKKTNGRYKLIFINPETDQFLFIACHYETGVMLPPFSKIHGGIDLTKLDQFLLSNIENEDQLRLTAEHLGYVIPKSYVPKIAYQSKKQTRYLELIYQNQTLYDFATLFNTYKQKYSTYANQKGLSKERVSKQISKDIKTELIWVQFFDELLKKIQIPEFYAYLKKERLLGEYIVGHIKNYLYENHKERHSSTEIYLKEAFSAYKPIRAMILCWQNYLDFLDYSCDDSKQLKVLDLDLFSHSEIKQLALLEHTLPAPHQPWYQKTQEPLTQGEIDYLEKHHYFEQLSESEKIEFVNRILSPDSKTSYQKKKL